MDLALKLFSADDGRVEGSVRRNPGGERVTFSGWLELLRLLEAALAARLLQRAGHGRGERDGGDPRAGGGCGYPGK